MGPGGQLYTVTLQGEALERKVGRLSPATASGGGRDWCSPRSCTTGTFYDLFFDSPAPKGQEKERLGYGNLDGLRLVLALDPQRPQLQGVGPGAGTALWPPGLCAFCWVPNSKGTGAMKLGWHNLGLQGHFNSSQHRPRDSECGERTWAMPGHLQPSSMPVAPELLGAPVFPSLCRDPTGSQSPLRTG